MAAQKSFENILGPVRDQAESLSEDDRRVLVNSLRKLATRLETPTDTTFRVANTPIELYITQVGIDSGLFSYLKEVGKPTKVAEIAEHTLLKDELLAGRVCRYLASYNAIEETGVDEFAASNVSTALTEPARAAGLAHHLFFLNQPLEQIPSLLKENGYKNIDDPTDCAFSRAYATKRVLFDWLPERPVFLKTFSTFLEKYQKDALMWTDVVPWTEHCRDWRGDVLFCDVGGYFGAQTRQFQELAARKHGLRGRIILQDLDGMLAGAPELPGIEKLAIDFFQAQPVRAAKFYYLRHVLHDHADARSATILRHIRDQMAPAGASVLLINDQVIPDAGAHPHSTSSDMVMMAMVAAQERTRAQWHDLLERQAGLKITAIRTCDPFSGFSVIECIKP